MSIDLLIAGASARAAACSAVRAGRIVAAADLFADRDLQLVAEATSIAEWPDGIERWAAAFDPSIPFVYVGGLENHPALLERIAATRAVFGPTGDVLRTVRTPERLAELFDKHAIPRPRLLGHPRCHTDHDRSRRWLVKPRRSAAGHGIDWFRDPSVSHGDDKYAQEFIDGTPGSAAWLAGDDFVELLGVTELLLPDATLAPVLGAFTYCGSISVERSDCDSLERIGRCLASAGLRGVFGVDFVRRNMPNGDKFVPIEVNPRYTAGMEVLERRAGRSFLDEHIAACSGRSRPGRTLPERSTLHGKRIVYARQRCRAGNLSLPSRVDLLSSSPCFDFADLPRPGTLIPAGAPICTVFASGGDRESCLERLTTLERRVLALCEPE